MFNNIFLNILMFIVAFIGFAILLTVLTKKKASSVRLPPISITNKELLELEYQHKTSAKPNADMAQMTGDEIAEITDNNLFQLSAFEKTRFDL